MVKTSEYKRYRNSLLIRKFILYVVLIVVFFVVLFINIDIYSKNYRDRLQPQIRRAVLQMAQIIPQLEESCIVLQIIMFVESSLRFPAIRALNREIKLIFDRNNIEIPFNQLVVHEAEDAAKEK